MKKLISILALLCVVGISHAQNFQFLYGYGNGKPVNFITSEIYKPLEHGAFYYFTDFEMDLDGYFDAYTEVSKYWNITKNGVSGTVQYNVGIHNDGADKFRIDPVYLVGIQRSVEVSDWILSIDLLYRYDQYTSQSGSQATFIFLKEWNKWLLSGYCDLWNSGLYEPNESPTVIMFEPQVFYSISKRISIGVEGRLSNYTLLTPYKDYVMAGIKWNLE
jgi:hypothetical protein